MDRYKMYEKIGSGGFGQVYRGEDRANNNQIVAIKLIGVTTNEQEIHPEVQELKGLPAHDNIVQFLDLYFPTKHKVAIVLEMCERDLEDYYRSNNVSVAESLELMKQCMHGVKHLHKHKMCHRDLKPQNILMKGGVPKITDFGLAKIMDQDSSGAKYKDMSSRCGTYDFAAPEIKQGKRYNKSVDIYSMGVTFVFMNDHGEENNESIQQLAAEMKSNDPSERPSVSEVLARLDAIEAD